MKRNILLAVIIILFGISLIPVEVACGHPKYLCMPAPDKAGYIDMYYETEPLFVFFLETVIPVNIPIRYSTEIRTFTLTK